MPVTQENGLACVALYADAPVAPGLEGQVLALCRRKNASLVVLAPAGEALATSIVEALLPALERASIDWSIIPLQGDPVKAAHCHLVAHPEPALVACEGGSALAQAIFDQGDTRHWLPMTVLIDVAPELGPVHNCFVGQNNCEQALGATRRRPGPPAKTDWLHPDLYRGF